MTTTRELLESFIKEQKAKFKKEKESINSETQLSILDCDSKYRTLLSVSEYGGHYEYGPIDVTRCKTQKDGSTSTDKQFKKCADKVVAEYEVCTAPFEKVRQEKLAALKVEKHRALGRS